ncbi:MAG: cell division protein FtsK [Phycisphaerae bacterium]|nr:cell division protein FtsK [Phycisphaerae bacterium]
MTDRGAAFHAMPSPTPDAARDAAEGAGAPTASDPLLAAGVLVEDLARSIEAHRADSASSRESSARRRADATARREQLVKDARESRDLALAAADAERTAAIEKEEHRYAERLQRIEREIETARREAHEKCEQAEEDARKALAETQWLADSVHESGLERNRVELEKVRERLTEARAVLEEVRGRVRSHLRRCRIAEPRSGEPRSGEPRSGEPRSSVPGDGPSEVRDPTALPMALVEIRGGAERIEKLTLPLIFRGVFPLLLVLPGAAIGGAIGAWLREADTAAILVGVGAGVAVSILALLCASLVARRQVGRQHRRIASAAATIDRLAESMLKQANEARRIADAELDANLARETADALAKFDPYLAELLARREARLAQLDGLGPKYRERAALERAERLEAADAEASRRRTDASRAAEEATAAAEREATEAIQSIDAEDADALERRRRAWDQARHRFECGCRALGDLAAPRARPWSDPAWRTWDPAGAPSLPLAVGGVEVDPARLVTAAKDPADDPARPWPAATSLPVLLSLPARRGLLVEVDAAQRPQGLALLQAAVLRILTTLPPGKVRLTLVDPVGLGASFAGFMHLADEDQAIVGDRIWTDPRHVEQRLTDLTEHMETVIQKYLRNEFGSIDAYNEKAGEIAEPYRVLVMADLPAGLTDAGAKRLASILESGARCGVLTLLLRDLRTPLPAALPPEDLARGAVRIRPAGATDPRLVVEAPGLDRLPLHLDEAPPAELLQSLAGRIGRSAKQASRVEVPFEAIAPAAKDRWTLDSGPRLAVSLGRAGATRLQQMVLGEGTAQHVLIAGKTGSGKSTLLHALVTNLAAWYSPEQVQLYLVDFKKGVEFKTYATHRLPHVKAVAVESDREFGLSVLQGLDAELKRRGDLFRAVGVQDLKGFRAARPKEPMPRTLLVIDEFQELFTEDDKVASEAGLLLDRIARQGRAFGVHAVLGSQTLGGAYSLARSTMGQMGVRIALQCSEADAQVILSDDNTAARLLSRPGEAIYNDAGGLVEGNSPFQVVWLPEEVRDRVLADVVELARARGLPPAMPLIFEGSAPADLASNAPLAAMLRDPAKRPSRELLRLWVGDPVAIRDPAAAELRRQPGANLVLVGQQIETTLGMLASSLIGAAVQRKGVGLKVMLLDGTPGDDPSHGTLPSLVDRLPFDARGVSPREVPEALAELAAEVVARQDDPTRDATTTLLVIHGLHRFRDLRRAEDDYGFSSDGGPPKPDKLLASILREGPSVGVHVVASTDTVPNLQRVVDRTGLRDFDWRVALQMGATDSSTLVDSPLASRLGLTRAYLHSEEQGLLEKFRPYPPPDPAFVEAVLERLASPG